MGFVTGPRARCPRTHSQWVAGPGRTPQGWAVGRGRAPNPGRPTAGQEPPPPPGAPWCRPHSAQSQLRGARAGGLVTGPHAHVPRSHCLQWVPAGDGPRLHALRTKDRPSGVGERPTTGTPHPGKSSPPGRGALVPPPKRAKPALNCARSGVGDKTQSPPPPPTPSG